jgi:hypothetical protein
MVTMKYSDISALIQVGDKIEFASNGFLGRLIRWFTKQTVNHTALASGEMGSNQNFVLEANAPGIELEPLIKDITSCSGAVYWTPLLMGFDALRPAIGKWAVDQCGTPYDYEGLFANMFGHVSANTKYDFCSEFYFCSLVAGGVLPQFKIVGCKVEDGHGNPVPAPRPGEFEKRFPDVFGETVRILL